MCVCVLERESKVRVCVRERESGVCLCVIGESEVRVCV